MDKHRYSNRDFPLTKYVGKLLSCFQDLFMLKILGKIQDSSVWNSLETNSFYFFTSEAAVLDCSSQYVFLKIMQNSMEKTKVRASFLLKLQTANFKSQAFKREACKFCKI